MMLILKNAKILCELLLRFKELEGDYTYITTIYLKGCEENKECLTFKYLIDQMELVDLDDIEDKNNFIPLLPYIINMLQYLATKKLISNVISNKENEDIISTISITINILNIKEILEGIKQGVVIVC